MTKKRIAIVFVLVLAFVLTFALAACDNQKIDQPQLNGVEGFADAQIDHQNGTIAFEVPSTTATLGLEVFKFGNGVAIKAYTDEALTNEVESLTLQFGANAYWLVLSNKDVKTTYKVTITRRATPDGDNEGDNEGGDGGGESSDGTLFAFDIPVAYAVGAAFPEDAYLGVRKDGAVTTVKLTAAMVSGFDTSAAGVKTVTVTYEGKSFEWTIRVIDIGGGAVTESVLDAAAEELLVGMMVDFTALKEYYSALRADAGASYEAIYEAAKAYIADAQESVEVAVKVLQTAGVTNEDMAAVAAEADKLSAAAKGFIERLAANVAGNSEGVSAIEVLRTLTEEDLTVCMNALNGIFDSVSTDKLAALFLSIVEMTVGAPGPNPIESVEPYFGMDVDFDALAAAAREAGLTEIAALIEGFKPGDIQREQVLPSLEVFKGGVAALKGVVKELTAIGAAKLAPAISVFGALIAEMQNDAGFSIEDLFEEYTYQQLTDAVHTLGTAIISVNNGASIGLGKAMAALKDFYIADQENDPYTTLKEYSAYLALFDALATADVKVVGYLLRGLTVKDITALFTDYDALTKAQAAQDENAATMASAKLYARLAQYIKPAYERLSPDAKGRFTSTLNAIVGAQTLGRTVDVAAVVEIVLSWAAYDLDALTAESAQEILESFGEIQSILGGPSLQYIKNRNSIVVIKAAADAAAIARALTAQNYISNTQSGMPVAVTAEQIKLCNNGVAEAFTAAPRGLFRIYFEADGEQHEISCYGAEQSDWSSPNPFLYYKNDRPIYAEQNVGEADLIAIIKEELARRSRSWSFRTKDGIAYVEKHLSFADAEITLTGTAEIGFHFAYLTLQDELIGKLVFVVPYYVHGDEGTLTEIRLNQNYLVIGTSLDELNWTKVFDYGRYSETWTSADTEKAPITVTGYDPAQAGEQTWTVACGDFSKQMKIRVLSETEAKEIEYVGLEHFAISGSGDDLSTYRMAISARTFGGETKKFTTVAELNAYLESIGSAQRFTAKWTSVQNEDGSTDIRIENINGNYWSFAVMVVSDFAATIVDGYLNHVIVEVPESIWNDQEALIAYLKASDALVTGTLRYADGTERTVTEADNMTLSALLSSLYGMVEFNNYGFTASVDRSRYLEIPILVQLVQPV